MVVQMFLGINHLGKTTCLFYVGMGTQAEIIWHAGLRQALGMGDRSINDSVLIRTPFGNVGLDRRGIIFVRINLRLILDEDGRLSV